MTKYYRIDPTISHKYNHNPFIPIQEDDYNLTEFEDLTYYRTRLNKTWFNLDINDLIEIDLEEYNDLLILQNYENVKLLKTSIKSIYPEAEISTQIVTNIIYLDAVILFDNFHIKNSSDKSHFIQELFVKIPIKIYNNKIEINNIKGIRTKMSKVEYHSTYMHSHLPRLHSTFENFCLGTSDIRSLTTELNNKFNKDIFELYLVQIEDYIKWESLEGSPHIRMSTIQWSSNNKIDTQIAFSEFKKYLSLYDMPITYNAFNNRFETNMTDEVIDNINTITKYKTKGDKVIVTVDEDYNKIEIPYNNKIYKFKLIDDESEEDEKFLKPTKEIIKYFEKQFSEKLKHSFREITNEEFISTQ